MKNAHWLVIVAIAAAGGFVVGSWDAMDEWKVSTQGEVSREGRAGSPIAKSQGRQAAGGKSGSKREGKMAGEDSLARLMQRYWSPPSMVLDPFDGGWIPSSASEALTERIVSEIYQAEESEFPGILAHARWKGQDAPWDVTLLSPMIRRWCDFSPRAALAWLRENEPLNLIDLEPDPFGGAEQRNPTPIIAQEAIDSDPGWALALAREWLDPATESADEHMIRSMRIASFNGDQFLYELVLQQPERALEFLGGAGGVLEKHGFMGWSSAMFELGREAEVSAYLDQKGYEENSVQRQSFVELLSSLDVNRAQAIVGADGGARQDAVLLRSMMESVGPDAAQEWFLERASSSDDRAERAGILVNSSALNRSFRERVAMADRFLEEGVDVGGAYLGLIRESSRRSVPGLAFEMIGRLPEELRRPQLESFLKSEVMSFDLFDGELDVTVNLLPTAVRQHARETGFGDVANSMLREQNDSQSVNRMIAILEELRADLEGGPPVTDPDPDE